MRKAWRRCDLLPKTLTLALSIALSGCVPVAGAPDAGSEATGDIVVNAGTDWAQNGTALLEAAARYEQALRSFPSPQLVLTSGRYDLGTATLSLSHGAQVVGAGDSAIQSRARVTVSASGDVALRNLVIVGEAGTEVAVAASAGTITLSSVHIAARDNDSAHRSIVGLETGRCTLLSLMDTDFNISSGLGAVGMRSSCQRVELRGVGILARVGAVVPNGLSVGMKLSDATVSGTRVAIQVDGFSREGGSPTVLGATFERSTGTLRFLHVVAESDITGGATGLHFTDSAVTIEDASLVLTPAEHNLGLRVVQTGTADLPPAGCRLDVRSSHVSSDGPAFDVGSGCYAFLFGGSVTGGGTTGAVECNYTRFGREVFKGACLTAN